MNLTAASREFTIYSRESWGKGYKERPIRAGCVIRSMGAYTETKDRLTNTVWALLSHPSQYETVLSHPHLLTQAIEEALRWEPPVQSCTRFVTRPVVVRGVELAPGEMVQCMVGAANRDPEHFADPELFDLWRSNARDHLSFATGKHFCLGAALTRIAPGRGSAQ